MIKYCKKCGRAIVPQFCGFEKDGKPIVREIYVNGYGEDVFCGYCATTCFFINGEMYRPKEKFNLSNSASLRST